MNTLEFWRKYSKLSLIVDGISSKYNDKLPECFGEDRDDTLDTMYHLNTKYKKVDDVAKDIDVFIENAYKLIFGLEKYSDKYTDIINEVQKVISENDL